VVLMLVVVVAIVLMTGLGFLLMVDDLRRAPRLTLRPTRRSADAMTKRVRWLLFLLEAGNNHERATMWIRSTRGTGT